MKLSTAFLSGLVFVAGSVGFLTAELRYDPIQNVMYSHPIASNINRVEYLGLIVNCGIVVENMTLVNRGVRPQWKDRLSQCCVFLQSINTPTALRLMADLKLNRISYANGDFMSKISQ